MTNFYFTSDHHFNHKRVIEFGHRPFSTLSEMETVLISNWNQTVKPSDTVFIVGDFNFLGTSNTFVLMNKLNGFKVFISGNHDKQQFLDSCIVNMLGKQFEVIHNPDYSSYMNVIHGHVHLPSAVKIHRQKNGRLFINVNVELWDYKPVSVKTLSKLINKFNKSK
jgi:calcineurin-like phosphoesterase family protein